MIADASPDYKQANEDIAAAARAKAAERGRLTVPRPVRIAWAGSVIVAGCVGAGLVLMVRPPDVVTEVLPLSQACEDAIEAARDYIREDAALDAAREARAAAGEAYDAAVATGTRQDVDAAFKRIDDTQRELGEVDAAHTAALRAFTDADNRCLTDVDAVRRASTSREVDRG